MIIILVCVIIRKPYKGRFPNFDEKECMDIAYYYFSNDVDYIFYQI